MTKNSRVKRKRMAYFLSITVVVLVGTASWAFYSLANDLVSQLMNWLASKYDVLSFMSITNVFSKRQTNGPCQKALIQIFQ